MLLKSEHDSGVNFGIDFLLSNLALTVSMECKSLLFVVPYDIGNDGFIGIAFFDHKGNRRLFCILDSEHLCRLGVDTLGKYSLSDKRIDESGFTR